MLLDKGPQVLRSIHISAASTALDLTAIFSIECQLHTRENNVLRLMNGKQNAVFQFSRDDQPMAIAALLLWPVGKHKHSLSCLFQPCKYYNIIIWHHDTQVRYFVENVLYISEQKNSILSREARCYCTTTFREFSSCVDVASHVGFWYRICFSVYFWLILLW